MVWAERTVYAEVLRWEGAWRAQGIKNTASKAGILWELGGRGKGNQAGGMAGAIFCRVLPPCYFVCFHHPIHPTQCRVHTVHTGNVFTIISNSAFTRSIDTY